MSMINDELEELRLERCKDKVRGYLKVRPKVTGVLNEEDHIYSLDHMLADRSEMLLYNNGRPRVIDELETDEGWDCFVKQLNTDIDRCEEIIKLFELIPNCNKLKFIRDCCDSMNVWIFEECVRRAVRSEHTDLKELNDIFRYRKKLNEKFEIDCSPYGNYDMIHSLDGTYVYRACRKGEVMDQCEIVWNTSWVEAACDVSDFYDGERYYPITVYKMKVTKDSILHCGELGVIVDMDFVKTADIEMIELDWELKK